MLIFFLIRRFSEQICTIRTFFGEKSVQSVQKKSAQSVQFLKKKSIKNAHLGKVKPFLKKTSKFNILFNVIFYSISSKLG